MLQPTDVLSIFAPRLQAAGVEWMVAGGVAARADIYCAGTDALAHRGLANRRIVRVFGMDVPIAPPEHVILHKLRFRHEGASERHLRDVRAMLRVLGDSVDVAALEHEAAALGLSREWSAMRALAD